MEWVTITAATVEDAKSLALDQLGVAGEDAEIEVVEEPKPGLFGRLRGEAIVRARVRPTSVRDTSRRERGGERSARRSERSERPATGAVMVLEMVLVTAAHHVRRAGAAVNAARPIAVPRAIHHVATTARRCHRPQCVMQRPLFLKGCLLPHRCRCAWSRPSTVTTSKLQSRVTI